MKGKQDHLGFELRSLISFPMTISNTISMPPHLSASVATVMRQKSQLMVIHVP